MPCRRSTWLGILCRSLAWLVIVWCVVPCCGLAILWRAVAWRTVLFYCLAWYAVACVSVLCHALAWLGRSVAWLVVACDAIRWFTMLLRADMLWLGVQWLCSLRWRLLAWLACRDVCGLAHCVGGLSNICCSMACCAVLWLGLAVLWLGLSWRAMPFHGVLCRSWVAIPWLGVQ